MLVPADDLSGVDSLVQKQGKQARELLQRVVAEHPGTPWALLAEEDLQTPLGYSWEERFTPIERPKQGDENARVQRRTDDKKRMLAKPKRRLPKNL